MSSIFKNDITFDNDDAVEIPDVEFKPISFVPTEVSDENGEVITSEEEYTIEGIDMSDFNDEQKRRVMMFLTDRIKYLEQKAEAEKQAVLQKIEVEARQKAEEIIAKAEEHRDEVIKHAQMQASEIYEKARTQGNKAGREEKAQEVRDFLEEASQILSEMKELQNERFNQYDKQIKWLALEVAEKLVYKKIDEDDSYLKELIKSAIKEAKEAEWLSVEVSSRFEELVKTLRAEYKLTDLNVDFELSDTAKPGDVVVNGSDRQVVASIDRQLTNIRDYFSSFEEFE